MNGQVEKRKKISLTQKEKEILFDLFLQALVPIAIAVIISSVVLFYGLKFLISKASFGNYGLNPGGFSYNVGQFISTYTIIASTNVLLMILLSIVVLYLILHSIVLPIMRITREARNCLENKSKTCIIVRNTDRLFVPLVEILNKFIMK